MTDKLPPESIDISISTLMDLSRKIGKLQGTVELIKDSQQELFDKLDALQDNPYCLAHTQAMKDISKGRSKLQQLEITGAVNNVKLALVVGLFSSVLTLLVTAVVQKVLL